VDQDEALTGGLFGPRHGRLDAVGGVVDVGSLDGGVAGLRTGEHLNVDAVVVIAAPAAGRLERAPSRQHGTGRQHLLDHRNAGRVGSDDGYADSTGDLVIAVEQPRVQLLATGAQPVLRTVIGTGDEAVERHGHVEHGTGHDRVLLA
jgi:hypothetical protein